MEKYDKEKGKSILLASEKSAIARINVILLHVCERGERQTNLSGCPAVMLGTWTFLLVDVL